MTSINSEQNQVQQQLLLTTRILHINLTAGTSNLLLQILPNYLLMFNMYAYIYLMHSLNGLSDANVGMS